MQEEEKREKLDEAGKVAGDDGQGGYKGTSRRMPYNDLMANFYHRLHEKASKDKVAVYKNIQALINEIGDESQNKFFR